MGVNLARNVGEELAGLRVYRLGVGGVGDKEVMVWRVDGDIIPAPIDDGVKWSGTCQLRA